jgi:hypothetical protein
MLVSSLTGCRKNCDSDGTELGAASPRRLQIPPLRSCGAPAGMARVGHVLLRKYARKVPSYMQPCQGLLDRGGFATKYRQGRTLPYAWNPLLPVTKGTISLATRYILAIIPFVIRRRSSSGAVWPGLSGGVALPKLSKLLNQEDALSAPCVRVNSALRRRHPRGALECCGQA